MTSRNGRDTVIRAWVASGSDPVLRREELVLDELRDDEVLVKVAAVGVCHSDIAFTDGSRPTPFPAVVGHEGAGVVLATGSRVEDFTEGDRVVMSFSSCGDCHACTTHRPSYCASFRALNSGFGVGTDQAVRARRMSGEEVTLGFFGQSSFADRAVTRARNLVHLPADVPFHLAAPLGCGIQTGAGAVLNALRVASGDALLVVGAGAVGMSAVIAATTVGAGRIVAVDPIEQRRTLAMTLGASAALTPSEALDSGFAAAHGSFDYAIDTTGRPAMIRAAVSAVHSTGTVIVIGGAPAETTLDVPLRDLVVGRQIRGAVEGDSVPQQFIPRLLALWREGRFALESLVTTFPDTDVNAAMQAMKRGDSIKPVMVTSSPADISKSSV